MVDKRKVKATDDWYVQEFRHGTIEGGAHNRDAVYKQRLLDAGMSEQDAGRRVKEMHDRLYAEWQARVARELQEP